MTFWNSIPVMLLLAAAVLVVPPSGAAAAIADVRVGAKVIDTAGGDVGTITSVKGDYLVIKTDKHETPVPRSSFTKIEKGLLFAMTREQLNSELDARLSEPLLEAGVTVYDPHGGVVGTVAEFSESLATVQTPTVAVQLPLSAFVRGPRGPVIGETAASLEVKAAAAGPAPGEITGLTAE